MTGRLQLRWLALIVAVLASVAFALPLLWMLGTSVKPIEEVTTASLRLLPEDPGNITKYARENYYSGRPHFTDANGIERTGHEGVLTSENVNFPVFLRNTVIVAVCGVLGMVLSSAIVAYGFGCIRWRGRGFFFGVLLATMMIPFPATMIPTYFIFKYLGWIGTLRPLWVPAWFAGAFNVFLLRQFFMQIPRELFDAGRIDGLSHWGIFWRIVMPLAKPALTVVALFHLIFVWNDFLAPLVYLHHQDTFTLALGLQFYQQQHGGTPWNTMMAACVLTVAPLVIVFLIAQKHLMGSMATSGLKA
ncbi:MAG: carbohydrate ABC transporter permease [Phycisphaerales bacterium]|nr:carbohydrate ABC transporter permease [Phycisphaerales bacterium]